MMEHEKPFADMTLDDVKSEICPYGAFNERLNFSDCDRYYQDHVEPADYVSVKVFVVAMTVIYKRIGLDSLIGSLNLLYPDGWSSKDESIDVEDNLDENGFEVIRALNVFGWEVQDQFFDNDEFDELGFDCVPDDIKANFKDMLDVFTGYFRGPVEEDEKEEDDYYDPEGWMTMGLMSSSRVGKYLYFMDKHKEVSYAQDGIIRFLLSKLDFPFNGHGYSDSKLIGIDYYIVWHYGFKNQMWDKFTKDVDYYYPLYAYYLDSFLDVAYSKLPIDEYCEQNPPPVIDYSKEGVDDSESDADV